MGNDSGSGMTPSVTEWKGQIIVTYFSVFDGDHEQGYITAVHIDAY